MFLGYIYIIRYVKFNMEVKGGITMKVTSQILSADFLKNLKSNIFENSSNSSGKVNNSKILNTSNSDDVLSITRENQKAVQLTLETFNEAIDKLNDVKSNLFEDPSKALSTQGNIIPETASMLI